MKIELEKTEAAEIVEKHFTEKWIPLQGQKWQVKWRDYGQTVTVESVDIETDRTTASEENTKGASDGQDNG